MPFLAEKEGKNEHEWLHPVNYTFFLQEPVVQFHAWQEKKICFSLPFGSVSEGQPIHGSWDNP